MLFLLAFLFPVPLCCGRVERPKDVPVRLFTTEFIRAPLRLFLEPRQCQVNKSQPHATLPRPTTALVYPVLLAVGLWPLSHWMTAAAPRRGRNRQKPQTFSDDNCSRV